MAMHDALAYDNRWASYNKEQYSTAHTLFIQLASTSHWDDLKVSKAISTLENAGFDTLPFELDIEETMVENDLGGISSR